MHQVIESLIGAISKNSCISREEAAGNLIYVLSLPSIQNEIIDHILFFNTVDLGLEIDLD